MTVTLLDFHAEWCGPCDQQEDILEDLEQEYDDVEFEYVDIEEDMERANQYNIQSVPTLILLEDGDIVKKLTGLQQEDTLADQLDNLTQ